MVATSDSCYESLVLVDNGTCNCDCYVADTPRALPRTFKAFSNLPLLCRLY